MRFRTLRLRMVASLLLALVVLGSAGCVQPPPKPWEAADKQLAASARQIEDRAKHEDLGYFRGLTVERERLPELVSQIRRSGIATNYAEHLQVESDADAALVYDQEGGTALSTPFSIRLSLQDGKPRIDQIIIGEDKGEVEARLGAELTRPVPSEVTTPPQISVALTQESLVAGIEQSALVRYANTSEKGVWVSRPLNSQIIITDTLGRQVWVFGPFSALDPIGAIRLQPFESTYEVVRFTAPQPGSYLLYARANAMLSSAISVKTTEQ